MNGYKSNGFNQAWNGEQDEEEWTEAVFRRHGSDYRIRFRNHQ